MKFSRIILDRMNRYTIQVLGNPYRIHQEIERCYDGDRSPGNRRYLWRLDEFQGEPCLYVLDDGSLDAGKFNRKYGKGEFVSTDYDQLLNRIANGQKWYFKIQCNPSKCEFNQGKRGKVMPLLHEKDQVDWLKRKGLENGFEVQNEGLHISKKHRTYFKKKNNNKATLSGVTFEGFLKVTDQEKLKKAMESGIGRGKGLGYGLLTLLPVQS